MNTDPVEAALEVACAAGEHDAIRVYADRLEERGYTDRAQLLVLWHSWGTKRFNWPRDLRVDVSRILRELSRGHDPRWLNQIGFPIWLTG